MGKRIEKLERIKGGTVDRNKINTWVDREIHANRINSQARTEIDKVMKHFKLADTSDQRRFVRIILGARIQKNRQALAAPYDVHPANRVLIELKNAAAVANGAVQNAQRQTNEAVREAEVAKQLATERWNAANAATKHINQIAEVQCQIREAQEQDNWKLKMDKMLSSFDEQAVSTLNEIGRHSQLLGRPFDEKFWTKIRNYLLEMSQLRLAACFPRVEMELRLSIGQAESSQGKLVQDRNSHAQSSVGTGAELSILLFDEELEQPINGGDAKDGSNIGEVSGLSLDSHSSEHQAPNHRSVQ